MSVGYPEPTAGDEHARREVRAPVPANYILQYGSLAGWPYRVARGLRDAGVSSINVIPIDSDVRDLDRRLPHDRVLSASGASRARRLIDRARFLAEAASNASLVHYHGGVILGARTHHLLEGPILKLRGIPMLMSFGGGDARITRTAHEKNPYFYRGTDDARDRRVRQYLKSISASIRHVATDQEMMTYVEPYFERCHLFRQPVDTGAIAYVEPAADRPPIVMHVPTETDVKGTTHVVAAAERLKAEGHRFTFRMVRQLSQAEMYRELAGCDVYVDELLCGAHGVTTVEAMAAGKPTLTYVRPDLVAQYPADLPIVNVNPDTIYHELKSIISDAARRVELSRRGRAYVERYHAVPVIVRDLLEIYRQVGFTKGHSAP